MLLDVWCSIIGVVLEMVCVVVGVETMMNIAGLVYLNR